MKRRYWISGLPRAFSWAAPALAALAAMCTAAAGAANIPPLPLQPPSGPPAAAIDLRTAAGVRLVNGAWRYADAVIVVSDFWAAGSDNQPSGAPVKTHDIEPHAGFADFDDSSWAVVAPETLEARRTNGRLAFNWYRIRITVPPSVDGFDTNGATIVFDASLDDYAEVWVDGELPRRAGQSGGPVVAGWNAANRLVVARNARPGQQIQLAVFGANGPLSQPPSNFIWMRRARLEFFAAQARGPHPVEPHEVNVVVDRLDPRIDAIVSRNPKVWKLAEGFQFTEGPVWVGASGGGGAHLLFSDPNANIIYRYGEDGTLSVFREQSGYAGKDVAEYRQPGSNGLALDPQQHRLTLDQHGNRRVVRLAADGTLAIVADRYQGKRLNSPNDLVYRSNGDLYFTDPPFGLPRFGDDPRKELAWNGVYGVLGGKLVLLTSELSGPNGIAFSPDEKFLYVGNWDDKRKIVMRYTVLDDGTLGPGSLFFDMTAAPGEDAIDGIKVDAEGNVYVSGPGGLWVLSAQGEHLGTIRTPRHAHNFAWGGKDGRTLYLCARDSLYRIELNIPGAGRPVR